MDVTITSVDYNDARGTVSYNYDELGNRTQVNKNGTVTNYTSNSLNQYTSVGGAAYSYDDNGNLTNDGFYKYYYDCENRLTDVNYAVNDNAVASYEYDYSGRRVRKTVYGSPDVVTQFCYSGSQVIAEYDGNGTLLRKFVYGPGIDEPIMMISVDGQTETEYYYHFDGLGSVTALSDSYGYIVEQCNYDVFGEPDCISGIGNPYKFTGRRYDAETGLYYYRARYYKPEIGRFMSPDPLGYRGGQNIYRYVDNNPTYWTDPWGLCPVTDPDKLKLLEELQNELQEMMDEEADFNKKYPPYNFKDHMEELQSPSMIFEVPMDIFGVMGDMVNVTERSLAEQELQRKREQHMKRIQEIMRQLYPREEPIPQVPTPQQPADPVDV